MEFESREKTTFFYFTALLEFTFSKPGTEPVTTKSKSDSPGVFQVSLNVVEEKFWGHFFGSFFDHNRTERNGESSNSCDASTTTERRRRRRWFFSGGGEGG